MTIATKNGVPIITSGSLARNCACCGPPNTCAACCPSYPSEIQAIIGVGSASDVYYYGERRFTSGSSNTIYSWLRKSSFNAQNLASGAYTLAQVSVSQFGAGDPLLHGTPCASYRYSAPAIAADETTAISWSVIATLYASQSGCSWQVQVNVTQTLHPLLITFDPLFPFILTSPFFNATEGGNLLTYPSQFVPDAHASPGIFRASMQDTVAVSASCSGGNATASSTPTLRLAGLTNYTCSPYSLFGTTLYCVVGVPGGAEVIPPSNRPNPYPGINSVDNLSGGGTIEGLSGSQPSINLSVTLNT